MQVSAVESPADCRADFLCVASQTPLTHFLRPVDEPDELQTAEATGRLDRGAYWAVRGSDGRWSLRTKGGRITSVTTAADAREALGQLLAGTHKSQAAKPGPSKRQRRGSTAVGSLVEPDVLGRKRGVTRNFSGVNQWSDPNVSDKGSHSPCKRSRLLKEMVSSVVPGTEWQKVEDTLKLAVETAEPRQRSQRPGGCSRRLVWQLRRGFPPLSRSVTRGPNPDPKAFKRC